ncbi:unnamed protein product [Vitrella brassicaformis CCMP3155]|uniref:Uncharacterized protein n=1 Tax=Vitrella brassicaformis (strain CCMP3155) TaxID=1169540 RepID=A0A0G4FJS1_VITBC|nr:unnamed protein product [Vitrella brassicaformis CCMP3155]|eukprot:CEM14006.1 unnamed protein product [Vitrella brassicaformis CCMP3155]
MNDNISADNGASHRHPSMRSHPPKSALFPLHGGDREHRLSAAAPEKALEFSSQRTAERAAAESDLQLAMEDCRQVKRSRPGSDAPAASSSAAAAADGGSASASDEARQRREERERRIFWGNAPPEIRSFIMAFPSPSIC